jgi:hypothetical protein
MDLCSTIVTRYALCRGQQWFGAGYHMIYAPAAYVVTFAWLYSYVLCVIKDVIIMSRKPLIGLGNLLHIPGVFLVKPVVNAV